MAVNKSIWGAPSDSVAKIDSLVTDGLTGTRNSLAYRVQEIEKHIHNRERWYGQSGVTGFLDEDSLDDWRLTAGAGEAYGAYVQLSNGTETAEGDATKRFDLHKIFVQQGNTNDKNYKVQVRIGATLATSAIATEFLYRSGANSVEAQPISIICGRYPCNCGIWVRSKCATDAATLDILVGLHIYPG